MKTPPLYLIDSFLMFCRSDNMVSAAEARQLSQPAMSHHLHQFESYFAQELFTMVGRKKELTKYGEELFRLLESKFGGLDAELKVLSDNYVSPENAQITIAGRSEILTYIAEIVSFSGRLVFQDADSAASIDLLRNKKVDLAISNQIQNVDDFFVKKIFTDSFCIIAPKAWGAFNDTMERADIERLCRRPYLSYKDVDVNLKALLSAHSVVEGPIFSKVISNWQAILRMVEARQGWTIAPSRYVSRLTMMNSWNLPRSLVDETSFYLISRREQRKIPWLKDFIGHLVAQI